MNETLLNATANTTIAGTPVIFNLGGINITLDVLLTFMNYTIMAIFGVLIGIVAMLWWSPFTRVVIKNALGKRLKFLNWHWVLSGKDTGGTIGIFEHNESGEQFQKMEAGAYLKHRAYIKNMMGAPFYLYADQDTRPLTTKYEQERDNEGNLLYYLDDAENQKKPYKDKQRVLVNQETETDETGNQTQISYVFDSSTKLQINKLDENEFGKTIKRCLKPFAWSHYDEYPPEQLDPQKIERGIAINRSWNKTNAEMNAQTSKNTTMLIFFLALVGAVCAAGALFVIMNKGGVIDSIKGDTVYLVNQTYNATRR